jgi:hypothetical protein
LSFLVRIVEQADGVLRADVRLEDDDGETEQVTVR